MHNLVLTTQEYRENLGLSTQDMTGDSEMRQNSTPNNFPAKLFLSVEEAAHCLSVGRTSFYELMNAGSFRTVRLGGRRLVDAASLAEFAASLLDAGKE